MKVAVQFVKAWSRYNTGDVAAFEAAQAEGLISTKIARKHKQQPKTAIESITLDIKVEELPGAQEAVAAMEQAGQELDRRAAEQDARRADLDRREAALDQREALLQASLSAPASAAAEDGAADKGEAEARPKGGLPKQGK